MPSRALPRPVGRSRRLRAPLALARVAFLSASLLVAAARPARAEAAALGLVRLQTAGAARDTTGARVVTSQTARATRAELTAAMERAERASVQGSSAERGRAQAEAAAIRARLRDGDFKPGDRVAMSAPGDTVSRELIVREGNAIDLPSGIPAFSLVGVLRAELSDALNAHLRKYVREPDVRLRPLYRVGVSGAVGRPGVYWLDGDVTLAEVLMRAGGPLPQSRPDRITVVRDGREVMDRKAYARLVREGRTVANSNLRPGDELRVPERAQRNWTQIATYTFFAVSSLTAILAIIRASYQ